MAAVLSVLLALALMCGLAAASPKSTAAESVGIWYETWYCVYGTYHVAQNLGRGSLRFLADTTGDGFDDAVLWNPVTHTWSVAANANGTGSFAPEAAIDTRGLCGAVGAEHFLVGNLRAGPGPDSMHLACIAANGTVFARSFSAGAPWLQWGTARIAAGFAPLLADVDGNGALDLVLPSGSGISVLLSSGSSFAPAATWSTEPVPADAMIAVGDVNGNGQADLAFIAADCIHVALSTGRAFAPSTEWVCFSRSTIVSFMLANVHTATRADAILYSGRGNWSIASSTGTSFTPFSNWVREHGMACDHGKCGQGEESVQQLVGAVFAGVPVAPVAVWARGLWAAVPPSYGTPTLYNTWEGWFLGYVPLIGKYDSGDSAAIASHFASLSAATVDYIIFDFTNNIGTEYIRDRGWIVCQQLAAYRRAHGSSLAYAIAIGGVQYTGNPETMEVEAAIAWDSWVMNTSCGGPDTYFHVDGKPLLLSYTSYAQREAWERLTNHTSTDRFTVRWVQGALPDQGSGCPAQSGGIDPHKPWYPPPADYGLYYGWGIPNGSLPNPDVMVVMPGWNNSEGCVVPRNVPSPGYFYSAMCWAPTLQHAPANIVLNSWNEFAEQTAMEPADSAGAPPGCDRWIDAAGQLAPAVYWDATVDNVRKWRALREAHRAERKPGAERMGADWSSP
eukprot:m.258322 g.258322  ORF g.258322 m.258322 type:complete len:675 (-) comp21439_c0_seq1:195-2219(-)